MNSVFQILLSKSGVLLIYKVLFYQGFSFYTQQELPDAERLFLRKVGEGTDFESWEQMTKSAVDLLFPENCEETARQKALIH